MPAHHTLLAASYWPLRVAKGIGRLVGAGANQLRVLAYHDTPPEDMGRLESQLRWLAKSWSFVTPARFAAMIAGDEPVRGRNLLVTFDDGFHSNRAAAEQVLKPLGIHAIFFAIADFVAMQDANEARRFIANRIQPGSDPAHLPQRWRNMSWDDLAALLEQGHVIGAHTRTHAKLAQVLDDAELDREIVTSADDLGRKLGTRVEHFAWPFGDLVSISERAHDLARRRYRCVYSGLRGDNVNGVSRFALRRDAAAAQDAQSNYSVFSNPLLGAMLEGAADFRYAESRARLDAWSRA